MNKENNTVVLEAVDMAYDYAMAVAEDNLIDGEFDESDRVAFLELLVVKLEDANS